MSDKKTMQRAAGKPLSFVQRFTAVGEIGLLVVFAVLFLIFSVASPYFFTARNLSNILGQISMTLVTAVGLSMLLISGEVDISIGSLQALVALPLLVIMNATGSFWLGAIVALVAGAVVGVLNGLIVTRLKVNSLITTLGMYYLLRGFVYLVTGKVPISDQSGKDLFFMIGNGKLFRFLPYTAILMFVVLFLFMWVLRSTTYGRRLYAVGGNPSVARAMGISPERMKLTAFVLCSFLASVSAVLLASRLGSAVHTAGIGFEFQVVAAVVLGGVSLAGGIGNLLGAFLGVLILGIIQNGLGMLEVNTQWQQVVTGGIIILAVFLDELKKRHG
jgi:ribose/xylose/arabinose/galactoside ABC-type transport system permease subunit